MKTKNIIIIMSVINIIIISFLVGRMSTHSEYSMAGRVIDDTTITTEDGNVWTTNISTSYIDWNVSVLLDDNGTPENKADDTIKDMRFTYPTKKYTQKHNLEEVK